MGTALAIEVEITPPFKGMHRYAKGITCPINDKSTPGVHMAPTRGICLPTSVSGGGSYKIY